MSKVGVRIIHGNIGILSEFSKSQGAYYTWGRIIHGNLRYSIAIVFLCICVCLTGYSQMAPPLT